MVAPQTVFILTPTWGNDPIRRAYFSDGLVHPPTSGDGSLETQDVTNETLTNFRKSSGLEKPKLSLQN